MGTDEILNVLLRDCLSSSTLTGTYAVNHLPIIVKTPAALTVNLSPFHQPGTR